MMPSSIESVAGANKAGNNVDFGKAISKGLNKVNDQQVEANISIEDLISGKKDINSVVASVAKADMSFKLLVGVRNKLVAAYQETMKMQI
jgi:flagellar hook-basal body complex protein FliE